MVTKAEGGCSFCVKAIELLEASGVEYQVIQMTSEELKQLAALHNTKATFPRVFMGGKLLGGFTNLRDVLEEPILRPSAGRFVYFPLLYPDLHELYKNGIASFWTPEEIDLSADVEHWKKMSEPERHFIRMVLGFFAGADGIVNENLITNLCQQVQVPEARAFYSFQAFNETQHAETYSLMLDTLVKDPEEKRTLFNAIQTVDSVSLKAQWALEKLQDTDLAFADRLVAFACVEGIFFSTSFCAIFWLRKRGMMPGLCLSNDFIARDEGLHQTFACTLFRLLRRKTEADVIHSVIKAAVEVEKAFVGELLPQNLIGMSAEGMSQYVEYVADNLSHQLGAGVIYGTKNPFEWMETIGLSGKANFFELRSSSYAKPAALKDSRFSLDVDF